MKRSSPTLSKHQCNDMLCKSQSMCFCRTHQMFSCIRCANKMHYNCHLTMIQSLDDVKTNLVEAKNLAMKIREILAENGLTVYIQDADDELRSFSDRCIEVEKNIKEAIKHKNYAQFDTLQLEVREIQNNMAKSETIRKVLFLSTTRIASFDYVSQVDSDMFSVKKSRDKIHTTVKDNLEHMKKKYSFQIGQFQKECKSKLTDEFKSQIQALKNQNNTKESELEHQKQVTETLQSDNSLLLAQQAFLEAQHQQLESSKSLLEQELSSKIVQIASAQDQHSKDQQAISNLLEEFKATAEGLEQTKLNAKSIFRSIYEEFDLEKPELVIDMQEDKWKKLIKAMADCRYSLEEFNRLSIDNVSNEDAVLKDFMEYSAPSSLKHFVFNHNYIKGLFGNRAVEVKFYLNGLDKILPNVVKEIYLRDLIIDESDLSKIIKFSFGAERLVIRYCKIFTSDLLDFSGPHSNLKYLSFVNCGNSNWCNMEWNRYPRRFEHIVVAIKNSPLSASLTKLNVRSCKISSPKVTELLQTHNLTHISLVREGSDPSKQ
ncbi:unnamed protein product [Moneuplotes crassus]|uniref:Uncharacterized protein n=1 Tax=Euplotes crassus TaxID=5936 RepID=A0AAD1U6R1_EUPCR|nr:unnamed protein product [Moneuplotes crassus]